MELPQLQLGPLSPRTNDAYNDVLHLRNHSRLATLLHLPIRPVVMKHPRLRLHPSIPQRHLLETPKTHSLVLPSRLTITAFTFLHFFVHACRYIHIYGYLLLPPPLFTPFRFDRCFFAQKEKMGAKGVLKRPVFLSLSIALSLSFSLRLVRSK